MNLHGIPRMTYDIDVVVALDKANLVKAEGALTQLGLRCQQPVSLSDFSDPAVRDEMLTSKNLIAVPFVDPDSPLNEVDVLVNPSSDAQGLIDRARIVELDGLAVNVVELSDLIELKRESGRDQDLDDLELLERVRDTQGD